jgi:16S rRNA (uracil1498-N3)-methyltransferase
MTQLQRIAIAPTQIDQQQITLTTEQQHYLSRVLRLRSGDRFIAIDGQGGWWLAELEHQLQARILEAIAIHTELPITVTLIVAMPKGSGMDDIVRQTTELGVSNIAPVISDRSLLQPSPQKLERWRRIAQEAAEQSERQIVPTILEPISLTASLQQWSAPQCYFCVARGSAPHLLKCLQNTISNHQTTIAIATGPEGGWTPTEVEQAIAAKFQPVSLGQQILRATTAPVVAIALVNAAIES